MILIGIAIIIAILGIMLALWGKFYNKRKVKLLGIFILLILAIFVLIFFIYAIESEQEELENKTEISQNDSFPVPDRIIYKNSKNEYFILNASNNNFATIYSEIFNRIDSTSDGKVIGYEEINNIKEQETFIEFDYNQKSKNFIFPLEQENIGMIKMLDDSGQIVKIKLENKEELLKKLNSATRNLEAYSFEKGKSYTSNTIIMSIQDELKIQQKVDGIYQMLIYDENTYQEVLNKTDFKIEGEMPKVDFLKQNVVVTISRYEIENIQENIGNIKYKFSSYIEGYQVNVLIVSKIVNINCIYCDVTYEPVQTVQITNYVTASGIIKNIYDNGIEIGLTDTYLTHDIVIKDTTYIKDYTNNKEIDFKELKVGDCIYVEGNQMTPYNDLEKVEANKILVCEKEKVKTEAQKYLKDSYRIDDLSIEYKEVDSNGKGYIIVVYNYENFIYPIKLNVNSQTETYLGMGYHIQSNYGYVLHEISNITLDTKITDIDNIAGYVKMIEYIAD